MSLPKRPKSLLSITLRGAMTLILGATCAMGIGATATADTINDGGFEGFALGSPMGQFGWTAKDVAAYNGTGFDIAIEDPSAVWGSELGSRALRVSNGQNTSNGFGSQLQTPSLVDEAGETEAQVSPLSGGVRQSRFSGSFDFASATKTYQPGMALSMAPDRGDGARMSYIRIADTLDGLEVTIAYVEATAPYDFIQVVVASGLSRDEVHHFEFSLDLVDGPGNDVLWTSVGGECSSFANSGSWEEYHRTTDEGAPPHGTKTMDSIMFRVNGAVVPANLNGGFYFDNFVLTSSTVPPMPPLGIPGAPAGPSAQANATTVAVTGTPIITNACAPVTTYTVTAWPTEGGTPATFTSPTPTFSFPAPFDGAFTLTMSATNSQGTSTNSAVDLTFDPVVPDETPICGVPGAPVTPSAHVSSTSVAVTGTPVTTDPCPPVTIYTVTAWPLGGGTPATFTSPTPTFSFPAPFDGAFTLTMSATNSQGTSADTRVSLTFDPVFAGDGGSGELAKTGTDATILLVAATAMVVFGAITVEARRRRTPRVEVTSSRP